MSERPAGAAPRLIWGALRGPELSKPEISALEELRPGGLILFARNLASPGQTRDLIAGAREVAREPLLVGIDQEGGRVNRLVGLDRTFERLPEARTQAGWSEEALRETWGAVGRALRALGFDVDFAPVVDLDASDGANAIGARSFGLDPGAVSDRAALVLAGLESAGVSGCLKHFPGLGGTAEDTHVESSVSPLSVDELWETHAAPYRALASKAPLVMSAHAEFSIDGAVAPATFSSPLLRGWLRDRIGFEGVVVSDDLEMGAVARGRTHGERAAEALSAGCDQVMFCRDLDGPRRARDVLEERLESGELPDGPLAESLARSAALQSRAESARDGVTLGDELFATACREVAERIASAVA